MPALSSVSLLTTLVVRNASTPVANATSDALQVVCAWPVSGQYGPGSRVLYYCLVAACVLARKSEWLRNASLAAALLFPAVAAVHGIVLAAVHVNGAVDMDVFGAFQLCSIGILAAPVTVRLSRTYFYDPGRNTIFVWTGLILAGLLSLTVEFYRSTTLRCTHNDNNQPMTLDVAKFPYGDTCGLQCDPNTGPVSPMRRGSANNIYVIPAPSKLTFNTATLLAAACCIPAILSLISMWNKIVEINWKRGSGDEEKNEQIDAVIEGTNGATIRRMNGVNSVIRKVLNGVEIPLFSAAVLAILIIGERNFFSHQVNYQTEPIASIGQWAPIAGTVMAALGSLLLLTVNGEAEKKHTTPAPSPLPHHCNCSHDHHIGGLQRQPTLQLPTDDTHSQDNNEHGNSGGDTDDVDSTTTDAGNRRKVANLLTSIGNYFGTAAHDDVSEFRRGRAVDYPELPGEEHRNPNLGQVRERYNLPRDAEGNLTPSLRQVRSRGSFAGSFASGSGGEGSEMQGTSFEQQHRPTVPSSPSGGDRRPKRSNTLEVPSPAHLGRSRSDSSPSGIASIVS